MCMELISNHFQRRSKCFTIGDRPISLSSVFACRTSNDSYLARLSKGPFPVHGATHCRLSDALHFSHPMVPDMFRKPCQDAFQLQLYPSLFYENYYISLTIFRPTDLKVISHKNSAAALLLIGPHYPHRLPTQLQQLPVVYLHTFFLPSRVFWELYTVTLITEISYLAGCRQGCRTFGTEKIRLTCSNSVLVIPAWLREIYHFVYDVCLAKGIGDRSVKEMAPDCTLGGERLQSYASMKLQLHRAVRAATATSRPPARIGRYSLMRRLHSGSAGQVFLARDIYSDDLVALKKACHALDVYRSEVAMACA